MTYKEFIEALEYNEYTKESENHYTKEVAYWTEIDVYVYECDGNVSSISIPTSSYSGDHPSSNDDHYENSSFESAASILELELPIKKD